MLGGGNKINMLRNKNTEAGRAQLQRQSSILRERHQENQRLTPTLAGTKEKPSTIAATASKTLPAATAAAAPLTVGKRLTRSSSISAAAPSPPPIAGRRLTRAATIEVEAPPPPTPARRSARLASAAAALPPPPRPARRVTRAWSTAMLAPTIDEASDGGPNTKRHKPNTDQDEHEQDTPTSSPSLETNSLSYRLKSVISELYLNVTKRLQLNYVPRCADDLENCYKRHYHAAEPVGPNDSQCDHLRAAIKNQRYLSFVNSVLDMPHRCEFPGDGIFLTLMELILNTNLKKTPNSEELYRKCIDAFGSVVNSYPPCWRSLRHYYRNFFTRGFNAENLKKMEPKNSSKIFDVLLAMLDHTLLQCNDAELRNVGNTNDPNAQPQPSDSRRSSLDQSICDSFKDAWEWEKRERDYQTFQALEPQERLDRLFVVLRLILKILETDLVMWMLHHHKQTKNWIFDKDKCPLAVLVFDMASHVRLTSVVKQLFGFFSLGVNMDLHRSRLEVLERFIVLVMITSNTADMEIKADGIKYPNLGKDTKKLINDFFKIFKARNQSKMSAYIMAVDLLRLPFVRYEFIDYFLNFSITESLSPKRVAYDLKKMRWLQYKPKAEIELSTDESEKEELSREQYLDMLLVALKAYSEWRGLLKLYLLCKTGKAVTPLRTTTDSTHRRPVQGNTVLQLDKMTRDISILEQKLRLSVCMSKPKIDLPLANICIDDELKLMYRNDMKYMVLLFEMIARISANDNIDVDFIDWRIYTKQFSPNEEIK